MNIGVRVLLIIVMSCGFFLPALSSTASASDCVIVINEFVAAKQGHIADEDGDYPDWIELYNCTDQAVSLNGWGLSDRLDEPYQWTFPEVGLAPKGYLLVWASGKDKRTPQAPLHANFRINANGEALILTDPQGQLIDKTPAIPTNKDQAIGRYPDGTATLYYLTHPSPGKANSTAHKTAVLAPPQFSHETGFYASPFDLTLSHEDPEVTLYYTLDGSEPDPDNLSGRSYRYKAQYQYPPETSDQHFAQRRYQTHRYEGPLPIRDRRTAPDILARIPTAFAQTPAAFPHPQPADTWVNRRIDTLNKGIDALNHTRRWLSDAWYTIKTGEAKLNKGTKEYIKRLRPYHYTDKYLIKGTVVRALAQDADGARSETVTHTAFIGERSIFDLPLKILTIPEKTLFDYETGIFVPGIEYDRWLGEHDDPKRGACSDKVGNMFWDSSQIDKSHGHIYTEHHPHGPAFSENIKLRVHGGCSRSNPLKSVRIYPPHPMAVFPDQTHHNLVRVNFRGAGSFSARETYIRDPLLHEVLKGLAFGTQRYQPYVSFLNGEYNGILTARDRKDHYYLADRYGLPTRDVDLLKRHQEIDRGDTNHYEQFLEFLRTANPATDDFFETVQETIDLNSFIDFYAASIYTARTDWPHNNIAYWRYRGTRDPSNPATDGRWRWLLYDLDSAFIKTPHETLAMAAGQGDERDEWSTFVFSALIRNPTIRQRFIIRLADLMNTTFQPERIHRIIDAMTEALTPEMPRHIHRWGKPRRMETWHKHLDYMKRFANERPAIQRQHLQAFFTLDDPITVSVSHTEGSVQLNSLTLGATPVDSRPPIAASDDAIHMEAALALPWQGQYFANMPLTLKARPAKGYDFSHWEGVSVPDELRDSPELTLTPDKDLAIRAVFTKHQEAAS